MTKRLKLCNTREEHLKCRRLHVRGTRSSLSGWLRNEDLVPGMLPHAKSEEKGLHLSARIVAKTMKANRRLYHYFWKAWMLLPLSTRPPSNRSKKAANFSSWLSRTRLIIHCSGFSTAAASLYGL